jgi:hypothetical protein
LAQTYGKNNQKIAQIDGKTVLKFAQTDGINREIL